MLFDCSEMVLREEECGQKTSIEDIPFKLSTSSQDIMSFISSMGNMNSFHNDGLQSTGDTSNPNHGYEQSLLGNVTNSPIDTKSKCGLGDSRDEHL
ncbi:hypothetical protein LOK49_Contig98G00009 [Camellia lanceoleosa]|nr:hypothetical protein LOK49_Contig98G00009 [Camellia lanceoleosa]